MIVLVVAALPLAILTMACDTFAGYTVMNRTNQPLVTWALQEDCSAVIGKRGNYLHEQIVQPNERAQYSQIYGGRVAKCVQVVTADRRLVLSEPYEEGRVYTVDEHTQPLGTTVPPRDQIPKQSIIENLKELSPADVVGLLFGLAFCMALILLAFAGIRGVYRRYRVKH